MKTSVFLLLVLCSARSVAADTYIKCDVYVDEGYKVRGHYVGQVSVAITDNGKTVKFVSGDTAPLKTSDQEYKWYLAGGGTKGSKWETTINRITGEYRLRAVNDDPAYPPVSIWTGSCKKAEQQF
jgi:hypothetical protein